MASRVADILFGNTDSSWSMKSGVTLLIEMLLLPLILVLKCGYKMIFNNKSSACSVKKESKDGEKGERRVAT